MSLKNILKDIVNSITDIFQKSEDAVKFKKYSDCILINEKGEFLALLRSNIDKFHPGVFSLPGGHIEENEEPIDAASRELYEETNIVLDSDDLSHFKTVSKENCEIHYFLGSVHSSDLKMILDNDEHQGYEWIKPDNIADKNFILDLGSTLEDWFNVQKEFEQKEEPLPIMQLPLMKSEKINSLEQELEDNFNKGEIDEEKYFGYKNKIQIIKSNFEDQLVIKKGKDGNDLVVKTKDETDEMRETFDKYINASFYYKDNLYDMDGLRIPIPEAKVQQVLQSYPSIYRFEEKFINDADSNAPILEGLPRKQFEQVLPVIEEYDKYYQDFEDELRVKFSGSENNHHEKVKDIKKVINEVTAGIISTNEMSFLISYLEDQIVETIDPLIELNTEDGKRQIYLSELKEFVHSLEEDYQFNFSDIKIVDLENYDDNDLKIKYFDPQDSFVIQTIHTKVKDHLTDKKILKLVDISKGKDSQQLKNGNDLHEKTNLTYEDLKNHAKETSREVLTRFVEISDDPILRKMAHDELDRREKEEQPQEEEDDKKKKIKKSEYEEVDSQMTEGAQAPEISPEPISEEPRKGCLMFYPKINKNKWISSVAKMIPADICVDDGYETNPHCTVLFGFDENAMSISKLTTLLETYCFAKRPQLVLDNISLFQNANDVVKIGVHDTNNFLTDLNTLLKHTFENHSNFPDYKPHFTLAYVQAGTGQMFDNRTIDPAEFGFENINEGYFVYSDANYSKQIIHTINALVDKKILKSEIETEE